MSISTSRPSRQNRAITGEDAHVEKARSAVADDGAERQLKVLCHPKYHTGMNEVKTMTSDSVPVKHLMLEAIEDLFEKYGRGEGRYKVNDVAELRRRLDALMK